MSSLTTSSEFIALVRKSGVLDEKRFSQRYPDESDLPNTPSDCAALLIKEGFLTSYQAKQLLAGKFKGLRLGTYKILQPLGQGGMGMVFLADHLSLNRKVAIKILPTDKVAAPLALERFQREARSAAALDHPNIVRLHDINHQGGVHFLVMEYVDGSDLQSFISKNGALHYMQAIQYIAQAAAGLQHAHEKGFVHRDIKPSNLMLTKEGTIKILDMGLARSFVDEEDNLTGQMGEETEIVGTVDYTSPEQALGKVVDERSDIYSLGTTLFTLITGRPPYRGSTTQKLAQHQMAEPPRMNKLKTIVPETLSDVVAKMMAKKPSDRYQTVGDVIDALAPWIPAPTTGNMIQEPLSRSDRMNPLSTTQNPKKTKKKRPKPLTKNNKNLLIAGMAGAGAIIGGILIALLSGGKETSPVTSIEVAKEQSRLIATSHRYKEPPAIEGVLPIGEDGRSLNLDFETGDLQDWTAEGEAYRDQPIQGDTVVIRHPEKGSNHQGNFWIGTWERHHDSPVGILTSVAFQVTHPWACFLVGGGEHAQTCVELIDVEKNEVFFRVSGTHNETMNYIPIDLSKMMGRKIQIRVVDQHSGSWGYVNFDNFRFYPQNPYPR